MTRSGALYLSARQGAADHRIAAGIAAAVGHTATTHRHACAAEYHDRNAAEIRAQLAAARRLGLPGSAGTVPAGYHGDSQVGNQLPVASGR